MYSHWGGVRRTHCKISVGADAPLAPPLTAPLYLIDQVQKGQSLADEIARFSSFLHQNILSDKCRKLTEKCLYQVQKWQSLAD